MYRKGIVRGGYYEVNIREERRKGCVGADKMKSQSTSLLDGKPSAWLIGPPHEPITPRKKKVEDAPSARPYK